MPVNTVTVPGAIKVYGTILFSYKLSQSSVLFLASRLSLLSTPVTRCQSISSYYFSDSDMLRDQRTDIKFVLLRVSFTKTLPE